jgi:hypothetical protein
MPNDTLPEINPAQRYSAALDCVNLINDRISAALPNQTAEQRWDDVDRNVRHLEIAVGWDIWTTEDLAPLNNAISSGREWLSASP